MIFFSMVNSLIIFRVGEQTPETFQAPAARAD
jgi:hypothetical protein